uniref:Uncharacterized protein n=1 Tax=Anguilla anguilla TaxID=7936 RepID=A0A0E9WQY8_ANGAN
MRTACVLNLPMNKGKTTSLCDQIQPFLLCPQTSKMVVVKTSKAQTSHLFWHFILKYIHRFF